MTTIMIECPECEGHGEIRHPRWGSRSCPSPEITCPLCHGNCEVSKLTAADWVEEREAQEARFALACTRPVPPPGEDEPF